MMAMNVVAGQEHDVGLQGIGHGYDMPDVTTRNVWAMMYVGQQGDLRAAKDRGKFGKGNRPANDTAPLGFQKRVDDCAGPKRAQRSSANPFQESPPIHALRSPWFVKP